MDGTPRCAVCGGPAKRKCTRCGRLFCDLHVRYGNPHFSLGSLRGSTGYYCDECWASYAREGRIARALITVIILVFAVAWIGILLFIFPSSPLFR